MGLTGRSILCIGVSSESDFEKLLANEDGGVCEGVLKDKVVRAVRACSLLKLTYKVAKEKKNGSVLAEKTDIVILWNLLKSK